jgi:hypothetical protein
MTGEQKQPKCPYYSQAFGNDLSILEYQTLVVLNGIKQKMPLAIIQEMNEKSLSLF